MTVRGLQGRSLEDIPEFFQQKCREGRLIRGNSPCEGLAAMKVFFWRIVSCEVHAKVGAGTDDKAGFPIKPCFIFPHGSFIV